MDFRAFVAEDRTLQGVQLEFRLTHAGVKEHSVRRYA